MKYLITGGAGYIGSHMVNFLKKTNAEITILDNLSTGHLYNIIDCEFINLDLKDKDKLFKKLYKRKFDGVFHFAGKSIVSESLIDPKSYYENNIVGTNNLLELIVKNDLNNFIFSSSAAVYGNTSVDLISEDHTKIPTNPYGESKLQAEKLINKFSNNYNINTVNLRYFNACGADPSGDYGEDRVNETHLIPNALKSLVGKKNQFTIFGSNYPTKDGTCIRDYVHVNDIVKAHYLAMSKLKEATLKNEFNIGLGLGFSILEIIAACNTVTQKKIELEYGDKRDGDPPTLIADNKKIKSALNWEPEYTCIKEIIKTAWNWHSKKHS